MKKALVKKPRACKAAATADEASELIEGLEYVFDAKNMKLFRKSK